MTDDDVDYKEIILGSLSVGMAYICDQPGMAASWRREADLLVKHFLDEAITSGETFTVCWPHGIADLLIWWQGERSRKDNDFPMAGMH